MNLVHLHYQCLMIKVRMFDLRVDKTVFKNVRLVCRLRKSSPARTPTVGSSASSSAISSSQTLVSDVTPTESITPLPEKTMEDGEQRSITDTPISASPAQTPSNRYFIMKSLTKEDLAWSVNNRVWATQPHNESLLNDAFRVSLYSCNISYDRIPRTCICFSVSTKAANSLVTPK